MTFKEAKSLLTPLENTFKPTMQIDFKSAENSGLFPKTKTKTVQIHQYGCGAT